MSDVPMLVVGFDGFLNAMPNGWFDIGSHDNPIARDAVKFLIDATEFFDIVVWGPRSLQFAGIATMQAAIILWTRMIVNNNTMHDLMNVLQFPAEMPTDYAVAIDGAGVKYGPAQETLSQDCKDFINYWQPMLARMAGKQ